MRRQAGYTLIELAVVILLIGLMLFLAAPRIRHTLIDDSLKSAARHITGTAKALRYESVREQVDYVLHLDLNNNAVWTYSADMTPEKRSERQKDAFKLPPDVKIADVYRIGQEKQIDGDATIIFFKRGYLQPTVVHLAKGDRALTMVFQPFLGVVELHDKYLDYSDIVQ
jgi:prepilin-type N-terminal cleavage/methylation domain-containing protein